MQTNYFKKAFLLFILVLGYTTLQAQVKIGDNPQNIDLSSVLELESTNKAFVITRVSTVQMNAIVPLEGAMVYNTDEQCLHYYDGVEWINICEAFANNLTFTSAALANPGNFETITITQDTPTNYNFEVGLLNASNIQDGTIGTTKIVNGSVTQTKLATNSVNSDKISDKSIQTIDIAPGLPNTVLQTNGAGDTVLWAQLDASTITGRDLTQGDNSITITNGLGATLEDTEVIVTDGGISTAKLEDNAVTTAKIGTVAGDENKILGTNATGDPEWQDASALAANLGEDVISTNGSITGTALDAALVTMDLEVKTDDITLEVNPDNTTGLQIIDGGVNTLQIANNAVTNLKIADDAVNTAKLEDNAVTTAKIGTVAGDENKILGTNATGDPEWQDASALAANLGEDVISTNGSITGTALDATLVAMDLEVKTDGVTLEVNPDNTTGLQIIDSGVNTLQIADNAVTTAKIGTVAGDENKILGTDATTGDPLWIDKTTIPISDFGAATADIDMATNKIINLPTPTANTDAANKAYVDAAVGGSAQVIVSFDAGNSIVESSNDGGAYYMDADASSTNELSDLDLTANQLTLTNAAAGASGVDLSGYLDNTDTQDLSIDGTGKIISLVDGGSVTINADDADASATNELSDLDLTANQLTLTNAAAGATGVDLSGYLDNTDTQDLSIDGTGKIISLVDGGSVTINADDADASATNELSDLDLTANQLTLTNAAAGATGVDLSGYLDNTDTQDLSIDGTGKIISLVDGGSVTINADDADASATNELSDLDLTANQLTLTNAAAGATGVDLSGYLDNTDTQDLSIDGTGKIISLVDGGSVTINADDADASATNEIQDLTITGTNLSLSNDPTPASISIITPEPWRNSDGTPATNSSTTINYLNGSIGIGTNNPSHSIHTTGSVRVQRGVVLNDGTIGEPALRFEDDLNTGVYSPYQDQITLMSDGIEAIRIGNNQNVGIGNFTPTGNTNPNSTLEVKGSFATAIRSVNTASVTILANDYTVILGNVVSSVVLPPATGATGRIYILKNISGAAINTNINYIPSNSATGIATLPIGVTQLQSDGGAWQQINN